MKNKKQLTLHLNFPKAEQFTVWSGDVPIDRKASGMAIRKLIDYKSTGLKKHAFNLIRFLKNSIFKFHYHKNLGVLGVVVGGTGMLTWKTAGLNSEYLPLSSGSFFYLPPYTVHEIKGNIFLALSNLVWFSELALWKAYES